MAADHRQSQQDGLSSHDLGCCACRLASFYAQTPSGFQVEYGHGGIEIDDDTLQVQTHQAASTWRHRAPAALAAAAD